VFGLACAQESVQGVDGTSSGHPDLTGPVDDLVSIPAE
jgi:hypothetical protein